VIEYLNEEMSQAEVYGVEVRCYGSEEGRMVVAPRLVGSTQQAVGRKTAGSPPRKVWKPDTLRDACADVDQPLRERLQAILRWAEERGAWLPAARALTPVLRIPGKGGDHIMSVCWDGRVQCMMRPERFAGGEGERDQFVEMLNRFPIFAYDVAQITSSKFSKHPITELAVADVAELLKQLERFTPSAPA
jgi:hypothetical protein